MTNDVTSIDPAKARLAAYIKQHTPRRPPALLIMHSPASGIASTYIIARIDGGVGASMFALMMSYLLYEQPFIIQAGGLKSWAYHGLGENDFVHIKTHEVEDRFSAPLDKRMEQPARVAIIEYEQAMPGQAIDATNLLSERFGAHAILCLVASADDDAFRLAETAREHGVERLLLFRERSLTPEPRRDIIKIPTVPKLIAKHLRTNPSSFEQCVDAWLGPVSGLTFLENLHKFGQQIAEQI